MGGVYRNVRVGRGLDEVGTNQRAWELDRISYVSQSRVQVSKEPPSDQDSVSRFPPHQLDS